MAQVHNPSLEQLDYHRFPVLHLFSHYQTLGGVESVLRLHWEFDAKIGVQSELIIYSEDPSHSSERVHCLGIHSDDSVSAVGGKLRAVTERLTERTAIYHLAWNFQFFCPNDHARRRILVIHTQTPGMERFLKRNAQFVDGILCVNSQMRPAVEASVPRSLHRRVGEVDYPINPPDERRPSELISKPIRLGFIGRLIIEQKRVDRIPQFCALLENLAVDYTFEVLGSGVHAHLLEEQRHQHKLVLHGVVQGAEYWHKLRELDCIVFFSDFEGTPISLLEALSQGIVPIFPAINCGADAYVSRVAEFLLYPPGDMKAAATIVQRLAQLSSDDIIALRQRCRESVQSHSLANYLKQTFDFTQQIWNLPRISRISSSLSTKLLGPVTLRQLNSIRQLTGTQTR